MLAFATAITVASVGLLSDRQMYGAGGETLLVALGILSLVASLIVAQMDYSGRSRALEANYKTLQQVSIDAEQFFVDPNVDSVRKLDALQRRYNAIIDAAENHTSGDYDRSRDKKCTSAIWRDRLITSAPYTSLAVPLAILVPFARGLV